MKAGIDEVFELLVTAPVASMPGICPAAIAVLMASFVEIKPITNRHSPDNKLLDITISGSATGSTKLDSKHNDYHYKRLI